MYNIVTSICVDRDNSKNHVRYPNLGKETKNRKNVYWKCVFTFFAVSTRVNPEKQHIVFTNDLEDVIIDGTNVKKRLGSLGVKIIHLDFGVFDPGKRSRAFRNAFYKLDVIKKLSEDSKPSILLDSDCLWHKKDPELDKIICSGNYLLLQDTYSRNDTPLCKIPHNISMKDMGEIYKSIGIDGYDKKFPVWYGGELIAGSPEYLKLLSEKILNVFEYCKLEEKQGRKVVFPNGSSIFDGDEFISSYVYNSIGLPIFDTQNTFSKRIWTLDNPNNVSEKDTEIPIWHLLGEKTTGLKDLFKEAIKEDSIFWTTNQLTEYVGRFVGIPKRPFVEKPFLEKVKGRVKNQLRPLKSIKSNLFWWYHKNYIRKI